MLEIQRLMLTLPAGFEKRAARIGRLTAEALAELPPAGRGGHIEALGVPAVSVQPGWSDRRIAGRLAGAIAAGIRARGG